MARLKTITPGEAEGQIKEVYEKVAKAMGKVPMLLQGLASSPAALKAYLALDGELAASTLTEPERHVVYVATSEANQCGYCTAAHCYLGKQSGLSEDELQNARGGGTAGAKLDVLTAFVREVINARGQVDDEALRSFHDAGYDDAAAVEVCSVIAEATFSNYFNRLNGTEIDFPAPPAS